LVAFGEAGEGAGHTGTDCGICDGFCGFVEKFGFDPPETAHPPARSYHFVDQILFDAVFGAEFLDVVFEGLHEAIAVFAFKDNAVGEEAVAERVL
jgi:hypothetical protein